MKKISAAVLAVVWMILLTLPVSAADSIFEQDFPLSQTAIDYDFQHQTLDQVLSQFRSEYGLNENNFSMSCYITGTGELHSFAGSTFRVAASTYKLPLNMVYYDMERNGEISPESYIDGYYLPTMHYETIVNSNNDMAISMLYDLGSFRRYREIMTRFYDQSYPSEYYSGNNINSDYMLAVLWELYCYQDLYPELMENLKIACRGQYFQKYQREFDIAHKYGYFDGAINDVGIIFTPQPVLVAAYTENVTYGEDTLGRLAELLTEYSLYHTEKQAAAELLAQAQAEAEEQARIEAEEAAAAEASAQATAEAAPSTPPVASTPSPSPSPEAPTPSPEPPAAARSPIPILVGFITLSAALLLGLLLGILLGRKRKH